MAAPGFNCTQLFELAQSRANRFAVNAQVFSQFFMCQARYRQLVLLVCLGVSQLQQEGGQACESTFEGGIDELGFELAEALFRAIEEGEGHVWSLLCQVCDIVPGDAIDARGGDGLREVALLSLL